MSDEGIERQVLMKMGAFCVLARLDASFANVYNLVSAISPC